MPWMETNVADQRLHFVRDFESGHWSMSELCERYGVTRPTGYKWVARHRTGGDRGLVERSRAPHTCPHRTSDELEALVVAARRHYGWGAKKLVKGSSARGIRTLPGRRAVRSTRCSSGTTCYGRTGA